MALTLEEAAEIAGLSIEDFIDWTQTMDGPDYYVALDTEEVPGIYTASDGRFLRKWYGVLLKAHSF